MLISVILAAHNDEKYIKEAIDSVLAQTHSELELIIIDDGSTDRTPKIIESYCDDRILFLKNERNMGLPYSLNRGMEIAKGKYIARMDGDDICFPKRLEKQLEYMESHSEIVLCGAGRVQFGMCQEKEIYAPERSEDLKVRLLFGSPIAHPTWFIRKDAFIKYHFKYDESYLFSQDYELISRIMQTCRVACVHEVLLKYRIKRKKATGRKYTIKVLKNIMEGLHLEVDRKEIDLLLGYEKNASESSTIRRAVSLYQKIILQNQKYQIFEQEALIKTLWKDLSIKYGWNLWRLFFYWDVIKPYKMLRAMITTKCNKVIR